MPDHLGQEYLCLGFLPLHDTPNRRDEPHVGLTSLAKAGDRIPQGPVGIDGKRCLGEYAESFCRVFQREMRWNLIGGVLAFSVLFCSALFSLSSLVNSGIVPS
jgi:hypothetical protein